MATLLVFPLVFAYGMDPAQGRHWCSKCCRVCSPRCRAAGIIGSLFFVLLVLAALMPSIALLEPAVAWLIQQFGLARLPAVCLVAGSSWLLGLGSVFSFNLWSGWHPLGFIPAFAGKTCLTSSTMHPRTSCCPSARC